jgi:hypothetical protein
MAVSMPALPRSVMSSKLSDDFLLLIVVVNVLISRSFVENIAGGYNFNAHVWRTNDGCHNIDFLGYLDAGHGYCCGSLPCYLTA